MLSCIYPCNIYWIGKLGWRSWCLQYVVWRDFHYKWLHMDRCKHSHNIDVWALSLSVPHLVVATKTWHKIQKKGMCEWGLVKALYYEVVKMHSVWVAQDLHHNTIQMAAIHVRDVLSVGLSQWVWHCFLIYESYSDHVLQNHKGGGSSSLFPDGCSPRITWYTAQIMTAMVQMETKMKKANPKVISRERMASQLGSHISENKSIVKIVIPYQCSAYLCIPQ